MEKEDSSAESIRLYVQISIESSKAKEQVERLNAIKDKLGDKLHWFTPQFKLGEENKSVIIGNEIDIPLSSLG